APGVLGGLLADEHHVVVRGEPEIDGDRVGPLVDGGSERGDGVLPEPGCVASEGDRQRHETSPLRDGSTTSLPGGSGSRVPPRGSLCGEDGKNAEKNAFPLAGIGPAGGCEAIHPRG